MWLKNKQQSPKLRIDLSQIPDRLYLVTVGCLMSSGILLHITAIVLGGRMGQFLVIYLASAGFLLSLLGFQVLLFASLSRVFALQKGTKIRNFFFTKLLQPGTLKAGTILGVVLIIFALALYCIQEGPAQSVAQDGGIVGGLLVSATYGFIGFELVVFSVVIRALTVDLPLDQDSISNDALD